MTKLVYTFYINDPDPDSGIFGCVAESEEQAEKLARKMGYTDFFLANTRELEPHESESFIDRSIRGNPFVGEQWRGVISAIEILVDERTFSRRNPTWTMQTYGHRFGLSPDTSPYVQAILEADGSLHVELSGNIVCDPPLTESQMEQLEWVGWTPPTDDEPRIPNFFRLFEPGWHPRYVAERIVESLTSIMGIGEDDFFNFDESPTTIAKIAEVPQLTRLPVNPKTNPNGSIFNLKLDTTDDTAPPTSTIKPEDIMFVEFDDGLPGRTESIAVRFWSALSTLPASIRFAFQRDGDDVMFLDREKFKIFVQAFPWGTRGEVVNIYTRVVVNVENGALLQADLRDGYHSTTLDLDPTLGQWSVDANFAMWFNVRIPLNALAVGNLFADILDYIEKTATDAQPVLVERYSGSIPTMFD